MVEIDSEIKVSIIIPVYNGSNYMKEAIDSALAQTYPNIEIIVVNDGSKDEGMTEKIALSYGNKIKYIKKENGGVSSALNYGISAMSGEYFSWLSHDDVYTPEKIEKQIEALKKSKKVDAAVICNWDTIDKDSKRIKVAQHLNEEAILNWNKALLCMLNKTFHGCAFLIPKKCFDKVGYFNEELRYCQDVLMWWKIFLSEVSLVFCDYVGVHARVHANQLTQTGSALYHHDAQIIGDIIIPEFTEKSSRDNNFLYMYAKGEAIHGNENVVKKCIQKGNEKNLFTLRQKIILKLLNIYGFIRPMIRKIYYRIFRNIDVK